MTIVDKWTGLEVRALREARRMTLAQFAEVIGVTERMVTAWEARGESITPRAANQEALDKMLSTSPPLRSTCTSASPAPPESRSYPRPTHRPQSTSRCATRPTGSSWP